MDNVIMFKTETSAPESLDDWKAYIAAASQIEKQAGQSLVDAIVEKGKRIAEFHAAYKANGQKWGKRWDDVCEKTIGIGKRMCARYIVVGKNTGPSGTHILPANIHSLYNLCMANLADHKVFDEAIASGEINSKMGREASLKIAHRAEGKKRPVSRTTMPIKFATSSHRIERPATGPLAAKTQEELWKLVDPEFTGTPTEFVDKYGHVQIMTAEQYATTRYSDWALAMRSLAKYAKSLPSLPEIDHNWLRSPKARDVGWMTDALEILRPLMAEAEALLERAKASQKEPA